MTNPLGTLFKNFSRNLRKAVHEPFHAGRVLFKKLEAMAFHEFGNGLAPWPETISLYLTYNCNLRCAMCGQWGENGSCRQLPGSVVSRTPPLGALLRLMDEASRFKPTVTFFGGEPLLYGELVPLLMFVKSRGLRVNMVTNGSRLAGFAGKLVGGGIDEIILSIDGDSALHDRIRGVAGLFEKIEAGVSRINRLKADRKTQRPVLTINTTLSKLNYLELGKIYDLALSWRAQNLNIHHLLFISESVYLQNEEALLRLLGISAPDFKGFVLGREVCGIDPGRLLEKLRDLKARDDRNLLGFYPNFTDEEIVEYYSSDSFTPRSYPLRCLSPWTCAYIFPDGSVRPCLSIDYAFGNIFDSPFRKIWNCEAAVRYRRVLLQNGLFPACSKCTELYRA